MYGLHMAKFFSRLVFKSAELDTSLIHEVTESSSLTESKERNTSQRQNLSAVKKSQTMQFCTSQKYQNVRSCAAEFAKMCSGFNEIL